MVSLLLLLAASPFGHDHYVAQDSAWCWFADPRALWVDGRIVAGGVSSQGDLLVNRYDPRTHTAQTATLEKGFERDDHAVPALLPLLDGRIAAFYSKHTGKDLWMRVSERAGDPTAWGAARSISPNDPNYKGPKGALTTYTYPNPQRLASEKNRILLFWRGMNWKPTLSWSDDDGETWATGRIVVSPANEDTNNRPYVKVAGDGRSRVHLAFTDGHPRNEPTNSIYYARYEKGAFHRIDGSLLASLDKLPFRPTDADVVYDGRAENVRAWIWDIADDRGNPVIVYARLPGEDHHVYRYAWWNGRRWVDRLITDGGKWFPTTPEGKREPEPHYSGGVVLDPQDPRFVYLSRPIDGRFEVERWFTPDGGDTWSHVALTGNSKHDSVRPFVPRGTRPATGPVAVFMNANRYVHYTDYRSTLQAADEDRGPWSANQPRRVLDAVWRWVRSNPSPYTKTEWMLAPLYAGVLAYADQTGQDEPSEWVQSIAEGLSWKLGPREFMADDQAVGQAYLSLYHRDRKPERIEAVKKWADAQLARSHDESLEWKDGIHNREWAWCDALFMAPPVLAMLAKETGDRRYLELASRLWWKTSDYLYDPSERLFFRDSRYFEPREANGEKVFWARGNGWVLAGLARVLDAMAPDDPLRAKWVEQFRAMASRIVEIQQPDGMWRSSLLDPGSYPAKETSGTGFFCYALSWGVRTGVLPEPKFRTASDRSFAALVGAVDPNGRLGWVQPIGQDPRTVKASDTDTFGVGALLLAGTERLQLSAQTTNHKPQTTTHRGG
ncbi:MAG: glycoside hydrolase family 88 protein [Fimbriimonadaceae bacterium]|nr:glycoside hydrolase family 88 protein [Chthonomonadaceae bacterium]MCO5297240.1 glycoside hydrolase family 88 protein [Fimbriimonadaceae bacterium]